MYSCSISGFALWHSSSFTFVAPSSWAKSVMNGMRTPAVHKPDRLSIGGDKGASTPDQPHSLQDSPLTPYSCRSERSSPVLRKISTPISSVNAASLTTLTPPERKSSGARLSAAMSKARSRLFAGKPGSTPSFQNVSLQSSRSAIGSLEEEVSSASPANSRSSTFKTNRSLDSSRKYSTQRSHALKQWRKIRTVSTGSDSSGATSSRAGEHPLFTNFPSGSSSFANLLLEVNLYNGHET